MAQSERNYKLDETEAPEGFYAISKDNIKERTCARRDENYCHFCDARTLCQANKEDWCLINRCMESEVVAFKNGKTYKRNDGQSVVFKRLPKV